MADVDSDCEILPTPPTKVSLHIPSKVKKTTAILIQPIVKTKLNKAQVEKEVAPPSTKASVKLPTESFVPRLCQPHILHQRLDRSELSISGLSKPSVFATAQLEVQPKQATKVMTPGLTFISAKPIRQDVADTKVKANECMDKSSKKRSSLVDLFVALHAKNARFYGKRK